MKAFRTTAPIFMKIAWRNLIRHRRRNITTGASIALGFAGVVLLGGYMLRMEHYLSSQAIYLEHGGHVSIYRHGGLDRALIDPDKVDLSETDQKKILEAVAALSVQPEFIGRYLKGQGLVSNGCQTYPFLATAVEPEIEAKVRTHPEILRWVPELVRLKRGKAFWDAGAPADGILITGMLANLLHKPLIAGDPEENVTNRDAIMTDCRAEESNRKIASHSGVQLIGNTFARGFAGIDASVSGHYTTGMALLEDSAVLLPLSLAQRFYDTDKVTWMALYFPNGSRILAGKMASELEQALHSRGLEDYEVYPYYSERVSPFYVGAMSFVYVMTGFFLILVCGVVVLSVMNSLQISFHERKSEVGTLRAIGFRPSAVSALFVRETAALCVLSLIAGSIVAALVATIINSMNLRFHIVGDAEKLQFALNPEPLFVVLVGIVFLALSLLAAHLACSRWARTQVVLLLEST